MPWRPRRGIEVHAVLFLWYWHKIGWGDQRHARTVFPFVRPCTYCPGDWVGVRVGLDGGRREFGISAPTGIRYPDLPACSESLYQLNCADPDVSYCRTAFYNILSTALCHCCELWFSVTVRWVWRSSGGMTLRQCVVGCRRYEVTWCALVGRFDPWKGRKYVASTRQYPIYNYYSVERTWLVLLYTGLFVSPWNISKIHNKYTTQRIMVVLTLIERETLQVCFTHFTDA